MLLLLNGVTVNTPNVGGDKIKLKSLCALLTMMCMVLCAFPLLEGTSSPGEKTNLGAVSVKDASTVNAAYKKTYKAYKKTYKRTYAKKYVRSYTKIKYSYAYKWVKKGKRWYKVRYIVRYTPKAPTPAPTPSAPRVPGIPQPDQYKSSIPYDSNDTNKTADQDWVSINPVSYDPQDRSYTCGPASLKMALTGYGVYVDEGWLAYTAWTSSSSGTSHDGLINAVASVNQRFGTSLSAWDEGFVSWDRLEGNYISQNKPVILHIESFLNPGKSGHYVLLTGINTIAGTVLLADPSSGYADRYVSFAEMQRKMQWVIDTGRSSRPIIPIVNT